MIRIIRIWLLLGKLQKACHEAEARHADHGMHEGHSFRACTDEQDFLTFVSKGDSKKRAIYADFLELADKKMKFIDSYKDGQAKIIRLNPDGLGFVGFFDLIEYILTHYQLTWTIIVVPIATFLFGLYFQSLLTHLVQTTVSEALVHLQTH